MVWYGAPGSGKGYQLKTYLSREHFANGLHARIFATIRQVIGRGDVANIVTLRRIFDQDPALEEFGGGRYLVQLVAAGARTTIEVKGYARLVHDPRVAAWADSGSVTPADLGQMFLRRRMPRPLDTVQKVHFCRHFTHPDGTAPWTPMRSR